MQISPRIGFCLSCSSQIIGHYLRAPATAVNSSPRSSSWPWSTKATRWSPSSKWCSFLTTLRLFSTSCFSTSCGPATSASFPPTPRWAPSSKLCSSWTSSMSFSTLCFSTSSRSAISASSPTRPSISESLSTPSSYLPCLLHSSLLRLCGPMEGRGVFHPYVSWWDSTQTQ